MTDGNYNGQVCVCVCVGGAFSVLLRDHFSYINMVAQSTVDIGGENTLIFNSKY